MAGVEHATVALTQTAALISHAAAAGGTDYADSRSQHSLQFVNETGVNVRVGGAGVTTSTGTVVTPNSSFEARDLGPNDKLYAVAASGSPNIQVLYVGVD